MRLQLFRSLWTNGFDLEAALRDVAAGAFDGVEGPVPAEASARREFAARLADVRAPFIAEIVTGGGYVPRHSSLEKHFDEFRLQAEAAIPCRPEFITVLAGCDRWPLDQTLAFLRRALDFCQELGVAACFETHRSRPTFNPWTTRELLLRLPELRLTCDFSHWCCVCERLVLDHEPEILWQCAAHTGHIHARVGYEQGPQVPHPAAPEYLAALEAHERWWRVLWSARQSAGHDAVTMTPEFGPDGYLHTSPFSNEPVASLDEINTWMALRQRAAFAEFSAAPATVD
jgi:hypothetical protein